MNATRTIITKTNRRVKGGGGVGVGRKEGGEKGGITGIEWIRPRWVSCTKAVK